MLVLQIVISLLLIFLILIQNKGVGFGRAMGGNMSFTKRGLEKVVFKMTFVLSILFIVISILQLL